MTFSYCLLDTPVPLFNYVAHVRLMPVTDGIDILDLGSAVHAPGGREAEMTSWWANRSTRRVSRRSATTRLWRHEGSMALISLQLEFSGSSGS